MVRGRFSKSLLFESKFEGSPYFPLTMEYPKYEKEQPLNLLAQINFVDGDMENLRQVDFRFIDFNKGRIAAKNEQLERIFKGIFYMKIFQKIKACSLALGHLNPI
ncbi:DUF1963 domain-containing protein [Lysinibacillus xylanilyticus]|uniref:DUF1963 domain-containing protein n=1 Tax=Lysinibacillus xylanilyticus TaxID=582475 RepID=UPI0038016D57